ncbi:MAG TPA: hypothetical protein V6C69_17220 [Trichormus sp.]
MTGSPPKELTTLQKPPATVRKYRLKPMVIARVFAELTVLVLLVGLPILLWSTGRLAILPTAGKAVIFTMAGIALFVMPWFGFVTYQVNASETGLMALSLFKKQSCQWQQIRGLSRRCSNNVLRYVVELDDKSEFTFPVLLKHCEALVEEIRRRLPSGSGAPKNPYRLFRNDPLAMSVQFLQAVGCLFFMVMIWIFCSNTMRTMHNSDAYAVLAFSIICTAALGWRCVVVALMAKTVELTRDAIIVSTLFFQKSYAWTEIKSINMPFPLLPEGFMLNTKKFSYLISTGMDSGDELQEAIKGRLPQTSGAA